MTFITLHQHNLYHEGDAIEVRADRILSIRQASGMGWCLTILQMQGGHNIEVSESPGPDQKAPCRKRTR